MVPLHPKCLISSEVMGANKKVPTPEPHMEIPVARALHLSK